MTEYVGVDATPAVGAAEMDPTVTLFTTGAEITKVFSAEVTPSIVTLK